MSNTEAGPSRIPMDAAQDRSAISAEAAATADDISDEEELFGSPIRLEDLEDSADEYQPSEAEDDGQGQVDIDSPDESGDEDDGEFPAAPNLEALRLAEQYAAPGLEEPTPASAAMTGVESTGATDMLDPMPVQHSRYRAGGMQRIEELGFFGADEDVQVGEDEITRLVAAIQGDEQRNSRRRRGGQDPAALEQASTSAQQSSESQMREEPDRQPQIRSWDQAMIQEREEFEDELRGAHGMKRKRSRRTRNAPRQQALSDEIKDLLSDANSDYVMGNYADAISSLHDIISIEPYARAAWTLLMLCFKEQEQHAEAIQAGIILASLSSSATAVEMFKELADSSRQLGARQQAVYCLQQAIIRSGKTDTDAMWDRAVILEQLQDSRNAARGYAMVVEHRPWDQEARDSAIRLFFGRQEYKQGAALLDTVRKWMMDRFPNYNQTTQPAQLGDAPDPVQMERLAATAATSSHSDSAMDQTNLTAPQDGDLNVNTFTERDLYSLVEFLLYAKEPIVAINVLRESVRWMQGRKDETFWDDVEYDDREFDEVRPGRENEDDEEMGRRAFDRSKDLLAAGRRKRRSRKGAQADSASSRPIATSASGRGGRTERDGDDDAEDDNRNAGDDADADADPDVDGNEDEDHDSNIELAARRRQWEAWESRAPVFGLSPSLRVLLGRARLMIGDVDEAERQFSVVLEHDVTVHSDLFADVAQAYMEYHHWQEAFDVLSEMDRVEDLRTAQFYEWLGTCCQNLGKLEQAVKYLQGVVDVRPSNLAVRYQLAEIYAELGDNDNALRLAASLIGANQRQATAAAALSVGGPSDAIEEPSSSFFSMSASAALDAGSDEEDDQDDSSTRKRSGRPGRPRKSRRRSRSGPTQNEKLEAVRELEYRAAVAKLADLEDVIFQEDWWRPEVSFDDFSDDAEPESSWDRFKGEQLGSSVSGTGSAAQAEHHARASRAEACKQWLEISSNLIDGFKNRRGMFKKDAKAPLLPRGFGRRGPNQSTNIHSRATALLSRLQDRMLDDENTSTEADNNGLPEFRGIHFDDWTILFIKYGCVLTKVGEWDAAMDHFRLVSSSYTMQLHDQRRLSLTLGTMACAIYQRDFNQVFIELRNLMNFYMFHDDIFRLGSSIANVGGIYGLGGFMNANWLRSLLRRIRQWHAVASGVSHMMRHGKWTMRTRFGKARHISNLENRQLFKRIPLGFADRVHELVQPHGEAAPAAAASSVQAAEARSNAAESGMQVDSDNETAGPGVVQVPEYDSLADVRPDRPGWDSGHGAKAVTLQDILRNGYPSRPSVIAESFYGQLMLLSKSNVPALYFFTKQYARIQSDPLLCLLCAVTFLTRALNRQVDNRHHAILQGFAYLSRYRKLRASGSLEVEYNFGRAFHQIGLLQQATFHYEKVLALAQTAEDVQKQAPSTSTDGSRIVSAGFDTTREAAFNLSLIYAAGGSAPRARAVYERWLVI
ncbi:hypothetical protein V8E36_001530 [Tilletia maclaganii]